MPRTNIWPATATERGDREVVVDLVNQVGEMRLVWTVDDLRREARADDRFKLHHPSQLSRHVHALDDNLVTRWDKRLDVGAVQDDSAPVRVRHQFVLTRRLAELNHAVPALDDLERVYHALWVAVESLGEEEVPTRAVTSVLRNIEDLALRTARNTLNHLITLWDRNQRAVEKRTPEGTRWSLWRPLGPRPDHPHFDRWVATYRELGLGGEHVPGSGHATLNSMAHELVVRALYLKKSSHWPAGHSVRIADIRAAAGRDPRAAELTRMLRERGRSIGSVLGDLTKERIVGRARVARPVIKVAAPQGESTYYDAPDEPGYERRRLYAPYQELRTELADYRLRQIESEHHQAAHLYRLAKSPALRAIAAVRRVTAHHQLEPAERLLEELNDNSVLLSKRVRMSVDEYAAKLQTVRSRMCSPDEAREVAMAELEPFGLDLDGLIQVARPLMTPDEYASYVAQTLRRNLSASEFLARVKALRRFANPDFTTQTDEDPSRSARYCVDRVEALCYLAERYQGRAYSLLREGSVVLGRDYRHPALLRVLAEETTPTDRRMGLAGLVLLGDDSAGRVALERLSTGSVSEIIDGLHALLALKQVDPGAWPDRVRRPRERTVRDAVTQTVLAARAERWLGQR